MAGQAVGTLYVELDLDATRYTRGQTQLLRDSQTASETLEKNFQNLGIKSSAHMDLMRSKVKLSYDAIVNDARSTANDILRAEEAKNRRLQEINNMQFGQQKTMLETVKQHWFAFTAAIGAAYAAMSAGKEFVDAALAMERINSTLKATMGSGEAAAREFAFISNESKRLGLNLESTALAFGKFAASTKNTSIEGEETRKIFLGVSEAVTAMKLPAETADGIFLALSQMMSKGKISAEELSGQLGERLPGAVKLTADAMGMTTQELLKNMQAGKLMSSDVLPALAEQLHKTYGAAALEAAEGGQAAINRFNNTMFETKAAIGAALMPALSDALTAFSGIGAGIQRIVMNTQLSFVELFGFVDKVVATVKMVGSALSFDATAAETFSNRMKNIRTAVDEQKKHITNMYEKSTDAAYTAAEKQKQYAENLARKQKETSTTTTKDAESAAKARIKASEEVEKAEKKQFETWTKASEDAVTQMKKEVDAGVALTKDGIKQKQEAEEAFRKWEQETWVKQAQYERDKINPERQKISADTWDEIQRYEYLTGNKIQADQVAFVGAMLLEYQNTFAGGVKTALDDIANHETTWGETMFGVVNTFATGARDELANNLFNVMTGRFDEIGIDWGNLWDGMMKTLSKSIADMIIEAAANEIKMKFGATISSALSGVLGTITNLGVNYIAGGSSGGYSGWSASDVEQIEFGGAHGGVVPGYASGGDSPANDTVHARLSPGEYIIPRSGVNAETLSMLEYIREWGQIPRGYAEGGMVNSTFADLLSMDRLLRSSYTGLYGDDISRNTEEFRRSQGQIGGYINGIPIYIGGSGTASQLGLYGFIDSTGGLQYQYGIPGSDAPWYKKIAGTVLPIAGGVLGGIYGGPWGAAGGAAVGSGLASWINEVPLDEAAKNALIAAAMAYAGAKMGGMGASTDLANTLGDMNATLAFNETIASGGDIVAANAAYSAAYEAAYNQVMASAFTDSATTIGKKSAVNFIKGQITSGLFGDQESGITFGGFEGNGVGANLSSILGSMAGGGFGFTLAKNGIDYVPRDNFPIIAHKGERVLTADENKGYGGETVIHNHLYIDGKEIKILSDKVAVARNKRGVNSTRRVYQ